MELIHDDHVGVQVCALAQRLVSKDLSGATNDGCLRVEGNVAGHHPHVGGAESIDKVKELFRHQRLQGGGVVRAAPARQGDEVGGQRNQRLSTARGGLGDDVVAVQQLQERIFLVGVEGATRLFSPIRKGFVEGVNVVGLLRVVEFIEYFV